MLRNPVGSVEHSRAFGRLPENISSSCGFSWRSGDHWKPFQIRYHPRKLNLRLVGSGCDAVLERGNVLGERRNQHEPGYVVVGRDCGVMGRLEQVGAPQVGNQYLNVIEMRDR